MNKLLRIILALCGFAIIILGLNVSLGGIITMGWQGQTNFLSVSNPDAFAVQDNNVRFIAGVWTGVGVLFLLGAMMLERMRPVLLACMSVVR